MSIEFGILRPGSTVTLIGAFRADTDESVFVELQPFLTQAAASAGQELDMCSSAQFEGAALSVFASCIAGWRPSVGGSPEAAAFMADLLRVAKHAEAFG